MPDDHNAYRGPITDTAAHFAASLVAMFHPRLEGGVNIEWDRGNDANNAILRLFGPRLDEFLSLCFDPVHPGRLQVFCNYRPQPGDDYLLFRYEHALMLQPGNMRQQIEKTPMWQGSFPESNPAAGLYVNRLGQPSLANYMCGKLDLPKFVYN